MIESYSAWKEKRSRKIENIQQTQLTEKFNSLHVSISCVVQLVDFH